MPWCRLISSLLVVSLLAAGRPALAEGEAQAPATQAKRLRFSLPLDGVVAGAALVGFAVPALVKSEIAPNTCRICERNPDGSVSVNGFDRSVRSGLVGAFHVTPPTWAKTSDIMVFGVLPLLSLGVDYWGANHGHLSLDVATDIGIVAEGVLLSGALDQVVKFSVGRQRPFVAYDSPYSAALRANAGPADDNLSFYSGHSSAAMSMTVGIARVLQLRTGSTWGYYTLVPLGILTSMMRVAADKHWTTDVLAGMAAGAACGFVLPTIHEW